MKTGEPGEPITIREGLGVASDSREDGFRGLDQALASELFRWSDVRFEDLAGGVGAWRGIPPGLRAGRFRVDRPVPALSVGWRGFGEVLAALVDRGFGVDFSFDLSGVVVGISKGGELVAEATGPFRPGEFFNGAPEALAKAALEAARSTNGDCQSETD